MSASGPGPVRHAVGVDIGGTKIACGVVSEAGEPAGEPLVLPTPEDACSTLDTVRPMVKELLACRPAVSAIGVGTAGLIDWPEGRIRWAGDLLLNPARIAMRRYLFARRHRLVPEIAPARQGADAGWIGAGLHALDQMSSLDRRAQ